MKAKIFSSYYKNIWSYSTLLQELFLFRQRVSPMAIKMKGIFKGLKIISQMFGNNPIHPSIFLLYFCIFCITWLEFLWIGFYIYIHIQILKVSIVKCMKKQYQLKSKWWKHKYLTRHLLFCSAQGAWDGDWVPYRCKACGSHRSGHQWHISKLGKNIITICSIMLYLLSWVYIIHIVL